MVEIIYTGQEIFPDFTAWLNEQIEQSKIEILKMQNKQYLDQVLTLNDTVDLLDELNEYDVFEKLLKKKEISEEQKIELKECYNEIVIGLNIED